ncbi:MAG: type II toxin-antitoxin system PemK/MazF family toxin [Candidatus Woesearchaeota archaeon]
MMKDGTSIEQRSIVLLPFPYTDLSSAKKRPALVVSNNRFNKASDDVVCCLITSNPAEVPHIISVTNKDMEKGFLEFDSKIKPYRLFTVSKRIVYKTIGLLKKEKYVLVAGEIRNLVEV